MTTGRINKCETFGSVDGPGIRFVFFVQGCPMRCLFCHNPETWNFNDSTSSEMTAQEAIKMALRYKPYWGKDGGITVSGGEPLADPDVLSDGTIPVFPHEQTDVSRETIKTNANSFFHFLPHR